MWTLTTAQILGWVLVLPAIWRGGVLWATYGDMQKSDGLAFGLGLLGMGFLSGSLLR